MGGFLCTMPEYCANGDGKLKDYEINGWLGTDPGKAGVIGIEWRHGTDVFYYYYYFKKERPSLLLHRCLAP